MNSCYMWNISLIKIKKIRWTDPISLPCRGRPAVLPLPSCRPLRRRHPSPPPLSTAISMRRIVIAPPSLPADAHRRRRRTSRRRAAREPTPGFFPASPASPDPTHGMPARSRSHRAIERSEVLTEGLLRIEPPPQAGDDAGTVRRGAHDIQRRVPPGRGRHGEARGVPGGRVGRTKAATTSGGDKGDPTNGRRRARGCRTWFS